MNDFFENNPVRIVTAVLFFLMMSPVIASSQDLPCNYFPAPCPNETSLTQADNWADRMKDNVALIQELKFEKKMRLQLYNILEEAAKKNHWEVYELTEEAFDGPPYIFISYEDWESTPYEKRPPASDDISFIVVVNKDSLALWRNWTIDFQSKMANVGQQYNSAAQDEGNDPLLKAYSDSENYYIRLQIKYSDDHQDQYLKDLKGNNTTGIKEHEKKEKWFSDRMNYFIKKYQDEQTKAYSGANQIMANEEDESTTNTKLFTEASIVLVHIMVNPGLVKTGIEDAGQRSLIPQHPLKISGASYAGLLTNTNTDTDENAYGLNYQGYIFNNPASVGMIRFGPFQSPDSYNNYRPLFCKRYNTKQTTIGLVQNIKCDVLQNLAVQIEGRKDKVLDVIKSINWDQINAMMGK